MLLRIRTFLLLLLVLTFSGNTLVEAQDYLGVLGEMLKPESAEKLELTEAQQEQLQQLRGRRTSAAIGLGQALREAPLAQQDTLRAEFGAESEKLAFELLNPEQQAKLAKYRIEWQGMLSLGAPEVAQALHLDELQKEVIRDWTERVKAARRTPAADRVRDEAQRAIRQELSDSQWAEWQVMAGQVARNEIGEPTPPERAAEVQAPAVAAYSPSDAMGETRVLDNSELPVDEIRLQMNFLLIALNII